MYLLRRGAQKETAKPNNGFRNETTCKLCVHTRNYTNKISHRNTFLQKNFLAYIQVHPRDFVFESMSLYPRACLTAGHDGTIFLIIAFLS